MTTDSASTANLNRDLARVFRAESGRVLAALILQTRDMQVAEDALQDACLQAIIQWSQDSLPRNPGAWLLSVARRRLIDAGRRAQLHSSEPVQHNIKNSLYQTSDSEACQPIPEERLRLIFTCCHPALAEPAQVALTLRNLCGLTTREIARAFLTSEATMQARLTRAKKKIKAANIGYQVPGREQLPERLSSVLSVIYLIYNESYGAFEGQSLTRKDLADEAIRLAELLFALLPRADTGGLLALIQLHNARRAARLSGDGKFIPLELQDRSLWDHNLITRGKATLDRAMQLGPPEPYQIQAAISALHSSAASWEKTDWVQIRLLYQRLYRLNPSSIVALNSAVAVANTGELTKAAAMLKVLFDELKDYQPFHAAAADIARKSGDIQLAKTHYQKAMELSNNAVEKGYLENALNTLER